MSKKYIFMVIKYPQTGTAMQALAALQDLTQRAVADLKDAVAVTKADTGELELHRTQEDWTVQGFLNGRLIGTIFADLFGSAGWDMNGALAGTAFSMLGQGIQELLLAEFAEKMAPDESAVTLLIEKADWRDALASMRVHNFGGKIVISQNVIGDLTRVEKLLEDEKNAAPMPETIELPAPKGLKYIEGIGDVYRKKLHKVGITNVEELLEKGSTPRGRQQIAETTGISDKLLLRWVNMADLYRIKGIGQEYAELLEAAGVDTVPELAQRVPENLLEKMVAANAQKKLVRRLPDLAKVQSWVAQAKSLPRVITY